MGTYRVRWSEQVHYYCDVEALDEQDAAQIWASGSAGEAYECGAEVNEDSVEVEEI